jgi:glycosyltransferase involved in cell wall biosynthesis
VSGQEPHVLLVLGSSVGGIGAHVASLVSGAHARGWQVTVAAPAATDARFGFTGRGARFVALDIPASPQPGDARAVGALRRLLREARPDVVHAHGMRAGLVAGLARPSALPLVVTWHNALLATGLRGRVLRRMQRYVARTATVTLGASGDLVDTARALGAADARLGPVAAPRLPPAARTPGQVRAELGLPDGQPLVLSVGRLHPQKSFHTLVAAAARWSALRPAPVVLIAGTGPAYLDLAAQISLSHAPVVLLGHRGDVADLLAAADVAVVSSVWEARQLFAQEALRAGVPLVATAVGGLPELVGDAAVLVPAGDVDALDEAVRDLLGDPARRRRLAGEGLRRAAGWPDEDATVEQVLAVYQEAARTASRSG